ncbi:MULTISPECIES: cyclic lactone autoinducer peptide [Blautia]|nr:MULTISPECIES: cyclic lactone autoinducer peptide [Blautia]
MKNVKENKEKKLVAVANVVADLTREGFCWFIFHQPKVPKALLEKKNKK